MKLFKAIGLGAILASSFCYANNSHADVELADGKIKLGAHARVRYEFKNDTDFGVAPGGDTNDTRDFVLLRLRPSFEYLPHEQLSIYFQPQFSGGWGEREGTVTALTPATAAPLSGTLNDPALGVHQAFIKYSPSDLFTLQVGRQEVNLGDQLVVGAVGWHNIGRSLDAVKMSFNLENGGIHVLWSLLDDAEASLARPNGAISGDAHLMGIYTAWDLGRFAKEFDVYALYRLDKTGAGATPHNYVIGGVRLKSKPSAIDYRLEATGQFGKQAGANHRAFQVDAEIGYTWEDWHQFRLGLEFFVASLNYNQILPTAHKWLGHIDLFGRRNVMGGVVHLSMKPGEKWKLGLDAHTIMRYKNTTGLSTLGGASGARLAAATGIGAGASTSKFAGEEIDIWVGYAPLKYLDFKVGASAFIPMGFIKNNVDNEIPLFGYVQMAAKF